MAMETKHQKVKDHLIKYGSITSIEAIEKYRATRLAAIIFNLRHKEGYDIRTIMVDHVDQYGDNTQYANYVLKGRDEQ